MAYFLGNDMAKKKKNYTDWRELEDQADEVISSILRRINTASSSVELKNYIYYKLPVQSVHMSTHVPIYLYLSSSSFLLFSH